MSSVHVAMPCVYARCHLVVILPVPPRVNSPAVGTTTAQANAFLWTNKLRN